MTGIKTATALAVFAGAAARVLGASEAPVPAPDPAPPAAAQAPTASPSSDADPSWNLHFQNTDIVQGHPGFPAQYSGVNSLKSHAELQNTESLDVYAGARLWRGAEFHLDGLMWQGFWLTHSVGAAGFPNGEAFKIGAQIPNFTFPRVFIRQTIGWGGETESVEDGELSLRGQQDVSRLTFTVGKFSSKDIFDNNAYANDPRTQFLNWTLMANGAWDYPADALGFDNGVSVELNEKDWTARYGIFQVSRVPNGIALDMSLTRAWGMVTEFEHRHTIQDHPGAVRLLAFANRARMGSYDEALDNPAIGAANIAVTREYRYKYGFGLNAEQEIVKNLGAFLRLGWNDGKTESFEFTDVDRTASLGLNIKGEPWARPDDTIAIAGVINGISASHRNFLAAGGTGILVGDGALDYGLERVMEVYYDVAVCKHCHTSLDYQFIANPAYNRDRGPVNVVGARLRVDF